MSDVDSGRTPAADKAPAAIAEVERLLEAAQRRALQLIGERGVLDWILLTEWFDAQGGTRGPATEFEERETEYVLRIALPGLDPAEPAGRTTRTRESLLTRGRLTYPIGNAGSYGAPVRGTASLLPAGDRQGDPLQRGSHPHCSQERRGRWYRCPAAAPLASSPGLGSRRARQRAARPWRSSPWPAPSVST